MEQVATFSASQLSYATIFGLGIMPYISASIFFQLLTTVVPSLEKIVKEGPAGQKKIQEYTRYATVPLCLIEAVFWVKIMYSQGWILEKYQDGVTVYLMAVLGLTISKRTCEPSSGAIGMKLKIIRTTFSQTPMKQTSVAISMTEALSG